jgi:glycosyltransferase involved in cell wall biosynthesis
MTESGAPPPHDVALVITGHRERTLAHHSLKAVLRCVRAANDAGLSVEVVGVLDRADDVTAEIFAEHLGSDGTLAGSSATTLLPVSHGDPGLSRNAGVARTTAPYVSVLDADNLPSANWLVEAVAVARRHGGRCVVHPESLVIFEGRTQVWPQPSSDHVRAENFYDRNYWDTFCLASREVFEELPYSATPRDGGFGPEDWHWHATTVAEGIEHLTTPGAHLFYRVKREGSVQDGHRGARSLLAPAALLTDPGRAAAVLREARTPHRVPRDRRPRFLRRLLQSDTGPATPAPAPLAGADLVRARVTPSVTAPAHYRYANPDLAGLSDAELVAHYREQGRSEGRRSWLTAEEIRALAPERFNYLHYRALYSDVVHLDDAGAIRHWLQRGVAEGRRALLTRRELRALRGLDVADYRRAHADLVHHDDRAIVQHYLEHGFREGRRASLTTDEREALMPADLTAVEDELRALHEIEPWIPLPGSASFTKVGPPRDGSLTPGSRVWWQVVAAIGERRPDVVFYAPWLRLGGGDILIARYANAVARLRPDLAVTVVTTHAASTHTEQLADGVQLVDLPSMTGYSDLVEDEKYQLVASITTQYTPRMVHSFNSPEFFDAVALFPRALANSSRLFLSTFVIDRGPHGELSSHLARRASDYLDPIFGVIVDNHALVEQFHDLYRFDRGTFIVHHQPVRLPQRRPWTPRTPGDRLQVAWAARFDRQKRLDILADVVEACAEAGIAVDWHVYGAPVIDRLAESKEHLERLRAAGARLHGPYATFTDLPLDDLDLFAITSETEGIPLTLLDVMAHRLPVMSSLVGGIPELVDETTGWPIDRFDDVAAYVAAIRAVAADRGESERRADAAYDLLASEFSWDTFDQRLEETPGYLP